MKIWRIRTGTGEPKWGHPNGWTITRYTRDWDARAYRGSVGNPTKKTSYEVRRLYSSARRVVKNFDYLRDARTWCDMNDHA